MVDFRINSANFFRRCVCVCVVKRKDIGGHESPTHSFIHGTCRAGSGHRRTCKSTVLTKACEYAIENQNSVSIWIKKIN